MDFYAHLDSSDFKKEKWLPVPISGLEHRYEVSSLGRVRSIGTGRGMKFGKILSPARMISNCGHKGYPFVVLGSNPLGIPFKNRDIHRLVCIAFHGEPPADIERPCARHKDDDSFNNRSSNLEWGTLEQNSRDAVRNERGERWLSTEDATSLLRGLMKGRTVDQAMGRFSVAKHVVMRLVDGSTYQHIDRKALMREVGIRKFELTNIQRGRNPNAVLDPVKRAKRHASIFKDVNKLGIAATAEKYGVSTVMVRKIRNGKYPH